MIIMNTPPFLASWKQLKLVATILCCVKLMRYGLLENRSPDISFYRDKSKFIPNMFNNNINDSLNNFFIQLPSLTYENFNEILNMLLDQIMQVVDEHAPLKSVSSKQKNCRENLSWQENFWVLLIRNANWTKLII